MALHELRVGGDRILINVGLLIYFCYYWV